jgi:hypothetical protein
MPAHEAHHKKAAHNLDLVSKINLELSDEWWDWQVTIVFYSALHIVNTYLARVHDLHYMTHVKVYDALNPENAMSVARIDEEPFVAYESLRKLSRRSRYLVHGDNGVNSPNQTFFTYEKHLAKAVRHYEVVAKWFKTKYGINIPAVDVKCMELQSGGAYSVKTS